MIRLQRNRWLRPEEKPDIAVEAVSAKGARPDWKRVIAMRECWTLILARFFTDPGDLLCDLLAA